MNCVIPFLSLIICNHLVACLAFDRVQSSTNGRYIPQSKVCVFSMVGNGETDIITSHVLYYGGTFGFPNLYVVDNHSSDGTYDILQGLQKKLGFNLLQRDEYSKKHLYMEELITEHEDQCDFAIPIDVDEFIVFTDPTRRTVITGVLLHMYFDELYEKTDGFDAYYMPIEFIPPTPAGSNFRHIEREVVNLYPRVWDEDENGNVMYAKSFFRVVKGVKRPKLGHGNHIHELHFENMAVKKFRTELGYIHFHYRNEQQFRVKAINNWLGMGFKMDSIEQVENSPGGPGSGYKDQILKILRNESVARVSNVDSNTAYDAYSFTNVLTWAHTILGNEF